MPNLSETSQSLFFLSFAWELGLAGPNPDEGGGFKTAERAGSGEQEPVGC
jgi:hypothetical protein